MNPSELASRLVDKGFVSDRFRNETEAIINEFSQTKDGDEIESVLLSRYKPIQGNPTNIIRFILSKLPDKPKEMVKQTATLTIAQEITLEKQDYEDAVAWQKAFKSEFSKPYDPSFERNPNIFMATPYRDMTKDMQDKYKANTFISVKAEAEEANTSMHEICRRKGIEYGLLLV